MQILAWSWGVGRVNGRPGVERRSDPSSDHRTLTRDRAVGEPQDDPSQRDQLGIANTIAFELVASKPVVCPAIALDDHGRTDESEVHLPSGHAWMELDRW